MKNAFSYYPHNFDGKKLTDQDLVGQIGDELLKSNVSILVGPDPSSAVIKVSFYAATHKTIDVKSPFEFIINSGVVHFTTIAVRLGFDPIGIFMKRL